MKGLPQEASFSVTNGKDGVSFRQRFPTILSGYSGQHRWTEDENENENESFSEDPEDPEHDKRDPCFAVQ